jgi:hypothetical protein
VAAQPEKGTVERNTGNFGRNGMSPVFSGRCISSVSYADVYITIIGDCGREHVTLSGPENIDMLRESGLDVTVCGVIELMTDEEILDTTLDKSEEILICAKKAD